MEIKCVKCKIIKGIDNFTKNKGKKIGINNICKTCHSEYRKKHYLLNKSKVINQVNNYREENPEKYLKINKYLKKAGRTFEIKCNKCDCSLFVTKNEFDKGVKKYCSKQCMNADNKSAYHHYLRGIKTRAIKTNKEFDLTEEFLKELLENTQKNSCAITNIKIIVKHPKEKTTLYDTASLDRINSQMGYTKDNVQWVALGINYMKLNFTDDELHMMLKLIKDNYTSLA